jgi:hypothetical protein
MAKITLKKLIGNNSHWTLNKSLVRTIGLNETLVLQHIIDLESVFKKDEIFQPVHKMADELGISEYAIKQAIGKLKSIDLISVERKSVGYMNFYSVNPEKVIEFMSGSAQPTSEVKSTHQSVEGVSEMNTTHSEYEINSPVDINSTLSEMNTTNSEYEIDIAITNNTTNNTEQIINTNNSTNPKAGNTKNITERILDILVDANSDNLIYRRAVEDYNELGGLDGVALIMQWDDSVKKNYAFQISNINSIR